MPDADCSVDESKLIHLEEYEQFLEEHPLIRPVPDDVLEEMKN